MRGGRARVRPRVDPPHLSGGLGSGAARMVSRHLVPRSGCQSSPDMGLDRVKKAHGSIFGAARVGLTPSASRPPSRRGQVLLAPSPICSSYVLIYLIQHAKASAPGNPRRGTTFDHVPWRRQGALPGETPKGAPERGRSPFGATMATGLISRTCLGNHSALIAARPLSSAKKLVIRLLLEPKPPPLPETG